MATVSPGSATTFEPVDQRLVGVVREVHVVEHDAARTGAGSTVSCLLGRLLVGVEQFEHPLERGDARLERGRHRREVRERLGELAGVLDHRLHVADAERTRRDLQTTDDGDQDELDVAHEDHRRLDQAGHELRAEARLVELVVVGTEACLGLALAAEALDDRVAGEHLLGLRVEARRCDATGR